MPEFSGATIAEFYLFKSYAQMCLLEFPFNLLSASKFRIISDPN